MAKPHLGMLLALPLVLGACAATAGNSGTASGPQSAPATAEAGKPETTDCVDLIRIDRSEVLDDQTILFHMKGGKVWKNTLPYKCPRLGFEKAFIHKTSINRLCSVDTITVLDTTTRMPGPSCGLGKFEAYTPPPKGKKAENAENAGQTE